MSASTEPALARSERATRDSAGPRSSRRAGPVVTIGDSGIFSEPPPSRLDGRLSVVIRAVTLVGIGAHAAFVPLFALAGVGVLAWFNVLSVAAWATARWANTANRQGLAVVLIATEVVLHAALAVALLGSDSAFHFYLFPLIPFLMFHARASERILRGAALLVLLVFAALHLGFDAVVPELEDRLRRLFSVVNVFVPMLALSVVSFYYRKASLRAEVRMERLASHDPLTRLVNRRRMAQRMAEEQQRSERGGRPFAVVMADIDHFKRINDDFGHDTGDDVLVEVSRRLRAGVRQPDVVSRWGGEEFLILLPETDAEGALRVTERLRGAIASPNFQSAGFDQQVTMTFGVALYEPGVELASVVRAADEALYAGKTTGRNRVELDPRRVAVPDPAGAGSSGAGPSGAV